MIFFSLYNDTFYAYKRVMENKKNEIILANSTNKAEYMRLVRACKSGKIIRIRRGVYAFPSALASTIPDIEKIIPQGVVCLYSAFRYYQLSTHIPSATCLAVAANRAIKAPQYPPIDLYFWKKNYLSFGVVDIAIEGYSVRMTDLERTVCDAVRYRNKIGLDTFGEVLTNYLQRPDRNLALLNSYARQLRVYNVMSIYLQSRV